MNELEKEMLATSFFDISEGCFKQGSPWSKKQYHSFFDQSHHHYLVKKHHDTIIGFLLLSVCFEDAEIELIGVSNEHQRDGVGHSLLKEGLALLRDKNVTGLLLEVRESNKKAQFFYDKMGFKEIGRRKKYYHKPQEDALIWHLDL